jgi:hypothetical protein
MASDVQVVANWRRSPVRLLMWGVAVFLLALPAVAMQFTAEVNWGPGDFLIMGAMLAAACGTVELGARVSASLAYRVAVSIAVLLSFLLVWMNLAAGIIGAEDNPANLMFAGVIAVAVAGATLARGRAAGMAAAMSAAAAAQFAVAAVALAGDMGAGEPVWPWGFAILMLGFTGGWLSSAWLFRSAAKAG